MRNSIIDSSTVVRLMSPATNGVVLATEKKSSTPLIDPQSSSKVNTITPNIGMVYSGMGPDYRVLVDKARKVSHTNYKRIYNEYPPTRILVQDVARVMQEATQSGGVRPYGVSLLIAGWDDGVEPDPEFKADEPEAEKKARAGKTGGILKGGPSLYQVDPSGSYFPWKATAIGKSATSAKTFLEKRYTEGLELEDAVHIALLTLKETIEGEMNGETVEIGIVGPPADHLLGYEGVEGARGPRFRKLTPQEIGNLPFARCLSLANKVNRGLLDELVERVVASNPEFQRKAPRIELLRLLLFFSFQSMPTQ